VIARVQFTLVYFGHIGLGYLLAPLMITRGCRNGKKARTKDIYFCIGVFSVFYHDVSCGFQECFRIDIMDLPELAHSAYKVSFLRGPEIFGGV
jgi:hypothetical protein